MTRAKSARKAEFGDFQTPIELARSVCRMLAARRSSYASILEPTCGQGTFLQASLESFPDAKRLVGVDINSDYLESARGRLIACKRVAKVDLLHGDFFRFDWRSLVNSLPLPLLIVGNPPWVTNADLGRLRSANLPPKRNFQNHRGIDALTGKSNFDISEWMLIRALGWGTGRDVTLAMLCKTVVARKVLEQAWRQDAPITHAAIYRLDALQHFGASVEACLFAVDTGGACTTRFAKDFEGLDSTEARRRFGVLDATLVSDVGAFERTRGLAGRSIRQWRSGVKHDCARIMELMSESAGLINGLGEAVDIEGDYLFPMLKSSEIASDGPCEPNRLMLVTQRAIGEETRSIQHVAPKTWEYLVDHAELLDRRASAVYRSRPRFSVFGVGDYTFAPWKVAISGFYKKLAFKVVGPVRRKPTVLDDTCYFLACRSQAEAKALADALNSPPAREFFRARIFWDAKRPIKKQVLAQMDLDALGRVLHLSAGQRSLLSGSRPPGSAQPGEG